MHRKTAYKYRYSIISWCQQLGEAQLDLEMLKAWINGFEAPRSPVAPPPKKKQRKLEIQTSFMWPENVSWWYVLQLFLTKFHQLDDTLDPENAWNVLSVLCCAFLPAGNLHVKEQIFFLGFKKLVDSCGLMDLVIRKLKVVPTEDSLDLSRDALRWGLTKDQDADGSTSKGRSPLGTSWGSTLRIVKMFWVNVGAKFASKSRHFKVTSRSKRSKRSKLGNRGFSAPWSVSPEPKGSFGVRKGGLTGCASKLQLDCFILVPKARERLPAGHMND